MMLLVFAALALGTNPTVASGHSKSVSRTVGRLESQFVEGRTKGDSITLATRPRSSGAFGLCEATVIWLPLKQASTQEPPISVREVYRVIDDVGLPSSRWSSRYERELQRRCSQSGAVLWQSENPFESNPRSAFFGYTGPSEGSGWTPTNLFAAWQAVQAVSLALGDGDAEIARQCAALKIARPSSCKSKLRLSELFDLSAEPCPDAPRKWCVKAAFFRSADRQKGESWLLTAETDDVGSSDILAVRDVRVEALTAVAD
jgi:hypothetical protein